MPKKQTRGYIHACACPLCGKANDFRDEADFALEQWQPFKCDHCKKIFHIARLMPTTIIWLAPGNPPPGKL